MRWILSIFIAATTTFAETPDLILLNANVYTARDDVPQAEAVAIRGERIVFVGKTHEAKKLAGKDTRVIDLAGKKILPGFTDAHAHIFGIGEREMTLNLEGTRTRDAFLEKVAARAKQTEPGKWITGRGWIETFWEPPVFPTASDLDKIAPDNPVFLTRADGHAAVANSAALKIAGITAETQSPFGGEILKDKGGAPTGIFVDKAKALIAKHIPEPTVADRQKALLLGAQRSVELGWCQVQNPGCSIDESLLIQRLYAEGRLKLRIYNAVSGPGPAADHLLEHGAVIGAHEGRFTQRAIKAYADGALGSRGAALLEKYADADTSGFLITKEEDLERLFERALRHGIQMQTHAIGDRANRIVLDLYEKVFRAVPADERKVREPRWRIEHAQVISPPDIKRFAKLEVIPSMQPSHAISDLFFAPSRLGPDRLAGAYAWQSLLESGAIIPGGSDAPVERGEPLIEFYAAVARKSLEGKSADGWHPEQAVTREQALRMFTIWPAQAAFEEKDRGTIEVGKLADLTVFSADIMKVPAPDILKARCLMTVIGGEIVFEAAHGVMSPDGPQ